MQSNRCQNPPPQLSKIIFVAGSTDPDHLACVKLGATKLPNKMSGEAFAARFCASCSALKLLKPPSYAGYGSFRMERDHLESSFIWIHEFEQTKLKMITHSFLFRPRSYFFPLSTAVSMKINFRVYDRESRKRICDKPFKASSCYVSTARNKHYLQCKVIYSYSFILPIHVFPISFKFYIHFHECP